MKRLLLIIALIISVVGLNAQSSEQIIIDYDGYSLKFTVTSVEDAECEVTCSTQPTDFTSITIPSAVEIEGSEFSVTSIGYAAFYQCPNLTNIEIPSTVTSIGERAFYQCPNLTNIDIPSGVTSIGERAFCLCSGLTSVTFGEDSQLTSIEAYTFYSVLP